MRTINFTIYGEPATKSRPRFTTRGGKVRTYTPDATKRNEAAMGAAFLAAVGRLAPSDRHMFEVVADFHVGNGQRRDVDNMLKLVLDGLNKIAWADDHQVMTVVGRKIFASDLARTEVTIRPIGIMPSREATCERCGETFPRPPSQAAKKYCSSECRSESLAAKRKKTCPTCGTKFVADRERQDHCSPDCGYKARHVEATCVSCGAEFTKPRHLNRSGNSYCSEGCKANYWRTHRKSDPKGTCDDCGGPTSKVTYKRCQDCHYKAGGRWADRGAATCPICHSFVSDDLTCNRGHTSTEGRSA